MPLTDGYLDSSRVSSLITLISIWKWATDFAKDPATPSKWSNTIRLRELILWFSLKPSLFMVSEDIPSSHLNMYLGGLNMQTPVKGQAPLPEGRSPQKADPPQKIDPLQKADSPSESRPPSEGRLPQKADPLRRQPPPSELTEWQTCINITLTRFAMRVVIIGTCTKCIPVCWLLATSTRDFLWLNKVHFYSIPTWLN